MSFLRRLRFDVALRRNRLRAQQDYRFTSIKSGDRIRIVMRNAAGQENELSVRDNGSDLPAFLQIFEERQYDLTGIKRHADIAARYHGIVDTDQTPLIIDAGANVGFGAMFFREHYPLAKVIAIEPEEGNYRELCARSDNLTVPVKAGLANFDGHLEVFDPGLGDMGYRTRPADSGVPAIQLSTLLDSHDGVPFILKIDIEGFETDLFDDPALIDRFMLVYFEMHDWMLPKQGTSSSFIRAIAQLDRDLLISGENLVSIANIYMD